MLLLCAALLLCLQLSLAQPPNFNQSSTWVVFHTAQSTLTSRSWPDCAWNLHQIKGNGQSSAFYQFGGQSATYSGGWSNINWLGTFDFSTNPTFSYGPASTITPTSFNYNWTGQFTGYNPISRVAGMTGVLSNGVVVLMAGKCAPNWGWQNDVIYSNSQGTNWSLATAAAPWMPRSDASTAVAPMTNIIVFAGGAGTPGYLNVSNPPAQLLSACLLSAARPLTVSACLSAAVSAASGRVDVQRRHGRELDVPDQLWLPGLPAGRDDVPVGRACRHVGQLADLLHAGAVQPQRQQHLPLDRPGQELAAHLQHVRAGREPAADRPHGQRRSEQPVHGRRH